MTKPSGNKIGRPKKSDLAAVRENRPVGRPKGTAAIINEYRDRMLNSPKSEKVLQKIMDAALNDEHQHQAAAWKIIADRIIPVSAFDQAKQAGAMPQISINISGLNEPKVSTSDDVIDV
jgi:uncharacterized protein involved in exopolysaccharide biosynthesis